MALVPANPELFPCGARLLLSSETSTVEAAGLGAADYITKSFRIPELRGKPDRLAGVLNVDQEKHILRETLRPRPGFTELIGVSVKMQRVYRLIEKVTPGTPIPH